MSLELLPPAETEEERAEVAVADLLGVHWVSPPYIAFMIDLGPMQRVFSRCGLRVYRRQTWWQGRGEDVAECHFCKDDAMSPDQR